MARSKARGASAVAFTTTLIALLIEGGRSVQELADECGVNRTTMERYLRGLRRRGLTFWSSYKQDARGYYSINCPQLAVAAGTMFDSPKPLTPAGRRARVRAKAKREQTQAGN